MKGRFVTALGIVAILIVAVSISGCIGSGTENHTSSQSGTYNPTQTHVTGETNTAHTGSTCRYVLHFPKGKITVNFTNTKLVVNNMTVVTAGSNNYWGAIKLYISSGCENETFQLVSSTNKVMIIPAFQRNPGVGGGTAIYITENGYGIEGQYYLVSTGVPKEFNLTIIPLDKNDTGVPQNITIIPRIVNSTSG